MFEKVDKKTALISAAICGIFVIFAASFVQQIILPSRSIIIINSVPDEKYLKMQAAAWNVVKAG